MDALWQKGLAIIKKLVDPQIFSTWFKPLRLIGVNEASVELEVPNRFFLEWLQEHYASLILETLKEVTKRDYSIMWRVMEEKENPPTPMPRGRGGGSEAEHLVERAAKEIGLNPKYTFENFVVGKGNEFAHAACFAVANHLSRKYNPLFILGGVGLGKTHLLQAISHCVLYNRSAKLCYYTSERFMNEFISSVRHEKMVEFRNRLRNVDILLIDDVQFWAGKEGTQEEFFHTFNALYESHKQIVVTSDRFPKDIQGLEERLRSRFEWGLMADIQPPDIETKVAILKKKAEMEGIPLLDDVALFLASVSGSNVRELEGYLIRIGAISSLSGKEITLDMAKEALKHIIKDHPEKVITIDDIQKAVATFFNIKVSDLRSKKKPKNIALPRQIAMYLIRERTSASFPEIGAAFGGKDHSTVIHACKKIGKAIEDNQDLRRTLRSIEGLLERC